MCFLLLQLCIHRIDNAFTGKKYLTALNMNFEFSKVAEKEHYTFSYLLFHSDIFKIK